MGILTSLGRRSVYFNLAPLERGGSLLGFLAFPSTGRGGKFSLCRHGARETTDVVLEEFVLALEFVMIRLDLVDAFRQGL